MKALSKIDLSCMSMHLLNTQFQGIPTKCLFDGGYCLIAISSVMCKNYCWALSKPVPTFRLRKVDGTSPSIEGEVHNLVVPIAGHQVPMNVLSIDHMDADCLLGRPFLVMVNALTNWKNSLYSMRIHSTWLIVQGSTGDARKARHLTTDEDSEWETHGRAPIVNDPPPAPRTHLQTRDTNIASSVADGMHVEIDHNDDQTLADIRSGAMFGFLKCKFTPPLDAPRLDAYLDARMWLLQDCAHAGLPSGRFAKQNRV
ncbi:uncharacterized protein EV422DRAFT_36122 [Fimicolochytrium jonesii]|uniref:uncharacterized protein n=1 Tax=Fimicolochytrium jonesii TaxID=1396493 RepID=UPI0022FE4395|nr:uncharacterized protein EV422DRAFT_36122 [Fimicolochytrium jonesii]KAI8821281.1 hypothetical protein EV422DRAFT_36122 [Fimicolochytrium jonesii]